MSRKNIIVLGFFTILPILYYIISICYLFGIGLDIKNDAYTDGSISNMLKILLPIHFSVIINIIVLLVIYIKNAFKNTNIEETKRTLWVIVLFFGNIVSMPIYWYINIWKPLKKNKIENNEK